MAVEKLITLLDEEEQEALMYSCSLIRAYVGELMGSGGGVVSMTMQSCVDRCTWDALE